MPTNAPKVQYYTTTNTHSLYLLTDPTTISVINDPIHGHFEVPQHALDFVDTPHVQRLRELKQLGATYLVYPGASQNRFEHSLGVSHLSANFVHALSSPSPSRNNNNTNNAFIHPFENSSHFNNSIKYVRIAGLCHDLGHGPFVRSSISIPILSIYSQAPH